MSKKVATLILFNFLLLITASILFIASYQVTDKFQKDPQQKKSNTPSQQPTNTTTVVPTSEQVSLYFVKLEDNGKSGKQIGCNDSLVKVTKSSKSNDMKSTLTELLSIKTSKYGDDLYNALYQSTIKVNDVQVKNGIANVKLVGKYYVGGVCDGPRFIGQLQETVLEFPEIKEAKITINELPLESLFSGKEEASPSATLSQ